MVGPKRLYYAIDLADNSRKATRNKVTDFFIDHLGFSQSEIEFIDRNKLSYDHDGVYWTKFNDA